MDHLNGLWQALATGVIVAAACSAIGAIAATTERVDRILTEHHDGEEDT
jgi:hypothetical protein